MKIFKSFRLTICINLECQLTLGVKKFKETSEMNEWTVMINAKI